MLLQPNIELLLNCTCNEVMAEGNRITGLKGWQLTTQTWHDVDGLYPSR